MTVSPVNLECVQGSDFRPPIGVEFCAQMCGVSMVNEVLPNNVFKLIIMNEFIL